ncbi:MAG TPA: hypothetical protein VF101_14375 [Gaiellaceae bacterium]
MIADVARLLAANALFLVAGVGVRRALARTDWPGLVRGLGLTYLAGLAAFGVVAQLALVAGLSLNLPEACAIAVSLFVAGLLRRPALTPSPPPVFTTSTTAVVAVVMTALGIRSLYEPLASWDAWAFWTPRAQSLVLLNGLDSHFLHAPSTPNPDYPLLLPSIEATVFRFMGHFDTRLIHLQFWLVVVAFLGALVALLRDQVRPAVLRAAVVAIACAPALASNAESAYADVPLGVFVALAGVLGWRWLVLGEESALHLLVVFAAAAAATKVEGRLFVGALFVALAVLAARDSLRRSGRCVAAAAVAGAIGILPWSVWTHVHNVHGAYHADLRGLAGHADRLPPTLATLIGHAVDPLEWLLLVPAALAAVVLAYRFAGERRTPSLATLAFVLSLSFLVATYWATSYVFEAHLRTSADRVVVAPVLLAAALTPVLLEWVLRAEERRAAYS